MNIDTFGVSHTENTTTPEMSSDASFAFDEVAHVRQKIEHRKAKQRKLKSIFGGLIGAIVILVVIVGYSQYKLFKLSQEEAGISQGGVASTFNASSTPKTGEEVIRALRRHILLPEGDPQIAEVQDVAKLKETQAFFKDAQNGDVVVVYETMIFVYRPSADIVVAASDISGVGQTKP